MACIYTDVIAHEISMAAIWFDVLDTPLSSGSLILCSASHKMMTLLPEAGISGRDK